MIRIWYNGTDTLPSASSTYGSENVWDDYRAVWHLQNLTDSTSNGFDLTASGSVATTSGGKMAGGYDLPGGSSDWLTIPDTVFNSPSAYAINIWYDPDNVNISTSLITFQDDYAVQLYQRSGDNIEHEVYSGSTHRADSGGITSGGGWYKLTGDYDGSDIRIFMNGVLDDTTSASDPVVISVASRIGAHRTATGSEINGKVDEVRLRNSESSTDWETTEYNNQNAPDTFSTAGDEETTGGSTDYPITASVGAFTLTGIATALQIGYQMVASLGTFTLTGIATALQIGYNLVAGTGAFVYTTFGAVLIAGGRLLAEAGTFVLTGFSATLGSPLVMVAEAGTFVLTGIASAFNRGIKMAVDSVAFVLTGFSVVYNIGKGMVAVVGNFTLTGFAVTFVWVKGVVAGAGTFVLTGVNAILRPSNIWSNPKDKNDVDWFNTDRS